MTALYGKGHATLVAWLLDEWWQAGPTVCCLEGFPGVGKTEVRHNLADRLAEKGIRTVSIDVPEPRDGQFDDVLLQLAQELTEAGDDRLARSIDAGADRPQLMGGLAGALQNPVLLVLDEFQNALESESGEPSELFRRVLRLVENRGHLPGRLLLLTDRSPHQGTWSERLTIRRVEGLSSEDGAAYLTALLRQQKLEREVPSDRLKDIAGWVGGNPRALRSVVAALRYEPLEALIGLQPESWELREREVSPALLQDLEQKLLQKVLARLAEPDHEVLFGLSVFRKPFPRDALNRFLAMQPDRDKVRARLTDNFLLKHDRGWYVLEKVAREIASRFLTDNPHRLRGAHSIAGEFYARHFRARRIVAGGRLGGDFVEARFHLVQADRHDDLREIVGAFEAHLKAEIQSTSRVPKDARERDERIAVLSGLLGDEGAKGLEYHLAQCLRARRQGPDMERALAHARRALGREAPAEAWVLAIRLAGEVEGADSAVALLRRGLNTVAPSGNLFSLYQSCAELLARDNRTGEAIALLREGIGKVPPQFNLFTLYQFCAELLARDNRTGEAIALLREGIGKVPPQFSLFSLYQSCAELLGRDNRTGEAIALLREGIGKVPQFGRHKLSEEALYLSAAASRCDLIEKFIAGKGGIPLSPVQEALGVVLLRQSDGDWAGAAAEAQRARGTASRYLALCIQEAFSWLAEGRPDEAQAALDRFPNALVHGKGNPFTWLACWIALARGDGKAALQFYSLYLGESEHTCLAPTDVDLLRLWNSPVPLSAPHPAYYHSTLPSSLTGLDHPVTRSPTWEACEEISLRVSGMMETQGVGSHDKSDSQEVPAATEVPRPRSPLEILAIATEWHSRHGGLSTLNRELCSALARAGVRVVCTVPAAQTPSAETKEVAAAREVGVELIIAAATHGADAMSGLYRRLSLPNGFIPNVVIGHGRMTGPAAQAQVHDFFPSSLRVHFVHMAPGEIEFYKGKDDAAEKAEERERLELELAKEAALVVAIGPRLAREAGNLLAAIQDPPPLHRLDPGIDTAPARTPPPGIHCLVLGRAEDLELKGLDIAAVSMARVSCSQTKFEHPPELVVRGAPQGTGASLRQQLLKLAGSDLAIRVREYTEDEEAIEQDLRRSTLLLMPSRREGFGLVALEALAAGTPILVSDKSGIGELLREQLGFVEAQSFVVPTTDDTNAAADAWSKAIEFVLRDRTAAFARANQLNLALAEKLSWDSAVSALINAIEKSQ